MKRKCSGTSFKETLPGGIGGHRTQEDVDGAEKALALIAAENRIPNLDDIAPVINPEPTQSKINNK